MRQFLKKHDVWLRLLSLLLAFVLWIIVRDADNPVKQNTFRDIPVTITGEEELLASQGLSVIESTATVDVVVEGRNNEVTDPTLRRKITATVDVSSITDGAGEYNRPVQVAVSSADIDPVRANPVSVSVLVDKVTTVSVPVRIDVTGTPAEGYRAGKAVPTTTESVTVEGPEAELKEVAYAYATISVEGERLTVTGECSIALYNDAGVPITGTHVTCQTDTVNVRVPLYPIETIPLTVTLKDGETLKGSQVRASISPQSVKVLGDQNTLAELTEISLGEIDLDSVRTDVPIQMDIKLPDNVRLDEGQPSTASVTITVADETDGIATRKVQVTQFAPNDTSQEQTPYTVNVLTGSVEIELRGTESALDQVDTDGFSIGLTFDSDSLGAGRHTVKGVVAATSLPAGVTVVEEDVEVEIEIVDNGSGGTDGDAAAGTAPPDAAQPEESGDGA